MQKTFEVTGPVELEVRLASGEIEIEAVELDCVEIELTAHDEDSQQLVDEARIELQDHAERPRVLVDVPRTARWRIQLRHRLRPQRHHLPCALPGRLARERQTQVGGRPRPRHDRRG